MTNQQLWAPAFEEWKAQGRTDEQIWAVKNFLTGAGGNLLRLTARDSYQRGYNKGQRKSPSA